MTFSVPATAPTPAQKSSDSLHAKLVRFLETICAHNMAVFDRHIEDVSSIFVKPNQCATLAQFLWLIFVPRQRRWGFVSPHRPPLT